MKKKVIADIKLIEKNIKNPKNGLPDDVFLFLSRISPLINVDLLIKNKKNETLLTWRGKGEKIKPGWHVPGGIIRFRDTIQNRIKKVALKELGTKVNFEKNPISINEIHLNQINRSHFISLLYKCVLIKKLPNSLKYKNNKPAIGQYCWFKTMPKNIISIHRIYKNYINEN